jgi:hypothetical protein
MKNLLLLLMFGSLAGCVSYQPQRLSTQSTLLNDVAHIRTELTQPFRAAPGQAMGCGVF